MDSPASHASSAGNDQPLEMKAKNPWHRPRIIFITVLFVIGIVSMVAIGVVQNKPLQQKYKYGIVLDAGSSHTSVYIYQWPAEKENNTGMVQQMDACNVPGVGISGYSTEPNRAGDSLKSCMDKARSIIPNHRHPETPVYLGATAGMRLLEMENAAASEKVLESVERVLQTYPFSYQGARIISGQEEGAFGWITVNYLNESLRQASGTLGALDLGGASTQITFVSGQKQESPDNSIDFRLYGHDYHVYTHSFLCYGKDQVLKLSLANEIRPVHTKTETIEVDDPCFHPGYRINKNFQSVFNSPCVTGLSYPEKNFVHVGSGNGTKCHAAVRKVFNDSGCSYSICSFNGIFQPRVEGQFGAFSAFFFVMDFLNLTTLSLDAAKEELGKYCATPWEIIKQNHPNVKEKYLAEYCFSGTYILTLLEDGYNFTSHNWQDIKFIKKIGNSDAGWTLGYMLNLTNMIPAESPDTPPLPYGGYVTLMVLFAVMILLLGLLACKVFRRPTGSAQKEII
ncbi:ectonucleoside triphosphate diphosphohydrolase 1 isoform X1 [Astyanax mexicanus]|uniref:ectonucleoside triphosphate diphosphohydrolase 1 isoform X1 n=1 Tax=Astyanax mexicanus TaxID=7994 RepID=UPI0020CB08EE|nr:ectonucleoside triphosphate diphosphohydrolase 1 isoform X1 [Astyanax mexicanus]